MRDVDERHAELLLQLLQLDLQLLAQRQIERAERLVEEEHGCSRSHEPGPRAAVPAESCPGFRCSKPARRTVRAPHRASPTLRCHTARGGSYSILDHGQWGYYA